MTTLAHKRRVLRHLEQQEAVMANARMKGPFYFTVFGNGDFPFDMLRYDSCWPYNSEDAASMQPAYYAGKPQRRSIVMETNNPHAPTTARWNSFLWGVVRGVDRDAHLSRKTG